MKIPLVQPKKVAVSRPRLFASTRNSLQIMSDKPVASAAEHAAGASTGSAAAGDASAKPGNASTEAPKKAAPQGNPAFRMMGIYN